MGGKQGGKVIGKTGKEGGKEGGKLGGKGTKGSSAGPRSGKQGALAASAALWEDDGVQWYEGMYESGTDEVDVEEDWVEPEDEPQAFCIAPHTQFAARQRLNWNYRLFAAAADGCHECVHRMIENGSVDPFAQSDNFHYNALEYAVHSRITRNINTWALESYLELLGLQVTRVGPGR